MQRAGERTNAVPAAGEVRAELRASDPVSFDAAPARMRRLAADAGVPADRTVESRSPVARHGRHAPVAGAGPRGRAGGRRGRPVGRHGRMRRRHLLARHCVLDGLGPVGGHDHGEPEYLDLATVPARVALLAGLVTRLA